MGIDNIMGYLQGMGNWALTKMEEELKCSASKPIFPEAWLRDHFDGVERPLKQNTFKGPLLELGL